MSAWSVKQTERYNHLVNAKINNKKKIKTNELFDINMFPNLANK